MKRYDTKSNGETPICTGISKNELISFHKKGRKYEKQWKKSQELLHFASIVGWNSLLQFCCCWYCCHTLIFLSTIHIHFDMKNNRRHPFQFIIFCIGYLCMRLDAMLRMFFVYSTSLFRSHMQYECMKWDAILQPNIIMMIQCANDNIEFLCELCVNLDIRYAHICI